MTGLPIRPDELDSPLWTADVPLAAAYRLVRTLNQPGPPNLWHVGPLVTPESLDTWGDFRAAQVAVHGREMWGPGEEALGDPGVVYIHCPAGPEDDLILTVVHRPSRGGWRVHHLGNYVLPEHVPHDLEL